MKIQSLGAIADEPVSHNPAIQKQVMVRQGDVENLVYFSRARFAPGEVAGAHSHEDMSEVFFVESGSGTIYINDTVHDLRPGTCVAVEPGDVHEVINSIAEELVLIYFGVLAAT